VASPLTFPTGNAMFGHIEFAYNGISICCTTTFWTNSAVPMHITTQDNDIMIAKERGNDIIHDI
jgi:hypothetical protein